MAEYIEREPILKFIEDGLNNPDKLKAFGHDAIEIMTEVQYAPAADVAPVVHGRWDSIGGIITCSECERWFNLLPIFSHYCPNCGAKMQGGTDE